MQPPNNPNLFTQMELAQAQGVVNNGGNNFMPSFGNIMDNGDFRNGMFMNQGFDGKRPGMMGQMEEGIMKKPKIDSCELQCTFTFT